MRPVRVKGNGALDFLIVDAIGGDEDSVIEHHRYCSVIKEPRDDVGDAGEVAFPEIAEEFVN